MDHRYRDAPTSFALCLLTYSADLSQPDLFLGRSRRAATRDGVAKPLTSEWDAVAG